MKKFIVYWLPVIVWAGMIFYSSAQPYQNQDIKPFLHGVIPLEWVESLFGNVDFDYAGEEVSVDALGEASFIEFFIRKGAHFTVYFVLAVLLFRAFNRTTLSYKSTLYITILMAILYAASDEYHQSFTANRSPHVEDVVLDSIGVITGAVITYIFYRRKKGAE